MFIVSTHRSVSPVRDMLTRAKRMIACHARREERLECAGLQTRGMRWPTVHLSMLFAGKPTFRLSLMDLPTRMILRSLQHSFSHATSLILLASPAWPRVSCYSRRTGLTGRLDWLDGLLLARVVACCTPSHYWLRGVDLRFITSTSGAINMQHLLTVRSFCLHSNPTLSSVQCALRGMMGGP
jgi:hypothetical protein